jgi:septal ring factor EnvC (AmiA/AmiB activator)
VQFVQTLITDEQALKIRLAIDMILQDPERFVMTDEERQEYERLAVFYGHAVTNPSAFSPTGEMAQTVKKLVRRAKGPAQPKSLRNKRKARQARRRAWQKIQRQQRREMAEQFNAAVEQLAKDREEAEAAAQELAAKYETEHKFDLFDGFGNLIMAGIPESALRDHAVVEGEKPHIILPGTAEALGL